MKTIFSKQLAALGLLTALLLSLFPQKNFAGETQDIQKLLIATDGSTRPYIRIYNLCRSALVLTRMNR